MVKSERVQLIEKIFNIDFSIIDIQSEINTCQDRITRKSKWGIYAFIADNYHTLMYKYEEKLKVLRFLREYKMTLQEQLDEINKQ